MIDPAQVALFLVIITLTVLLVVLGIQVFFILREFRKTVVKTNQILDRANALTSNISAPISSLSAILTGIKTGSLLANFLKRKEKNQKAKDE